MNKFLTLDVWSTSNQWLHDYIRKEDAQSIKCATLSPDGKKLIFYKIANPTPESIPAYEIEIPYPDIDTVIQKVANAVENNIPVLTQGGSIKDSGVAITDVATKTWTLEEIEQRLIDVGKLRKEIVQELPSPEQADYNTFYLIKVTEIAGKDNYEIWTKIGNELVLIDDTSVNLEGYVTTMMLESELTKAKADAVKEATEAAALDATSKADKALGDAKKYVDEKVNPLTERVTNIETNMTSVNTSILTMQGTLSSHGDRITELEERVGDMEIATIEEALAAFNAVFNPAR